MQPFLSRYSIPLHQTNCKWQLITMFTILQSLFPYLFRQVWEASWKSLKMRKIGIFVLCNCTLGCKKVKFTNLLCKVVVHTVANSCAKYHLKITFLYWEIAAARCHVVENAHFQKKPFLSLETLKIWKTVLLTGCVSFDNGKLNFTFILLRPNSSFLCKIAY